MLANSASSKLLGTGRARGAGRAQCGRALGAGIGQCEMFGAGRRRRGLGAARANRRGLSLFEVLLALAIFVAALAAMSPLWTSGMRGGVKARLYTEAVVRGQSKLAEIVAGVEPFQAASGVAFTDDPNWVWSAELTPSDTTDLYKVDVTVSRSATAGVASDVSFTVSRLMRDPQVFLDAAAAAASADTSTTSSDGSTSTSRSN